MQDDAIRGSGAYERKIIYLLCALAAVRVFIFSAAFPLINNVDEYAHLDLVVKYSHGDIPRGVEPISREAMEYLVIYGSQEFLWPPRTFPGGKFPPPPWTQPAEKVAPLLLAREQKWQGPNLESTQPPLYYLLAGVWWRVGGWLGFEGGRLVYWLRFLNILFVVLVVWMAYRAARLVFPDNSFIRPGVPALVAFLPQTAFYSIDNDILSPVCFGAAFICIIKLWEAETPGVRLGAATGLALATVFLTKMSNLPLLAVAFAAILWKIFQMAKAKQMRAALPAMAALFCCAFLPMAAWVAWCKIQFGDFTGSAAKVGILGWTVKPFSAWWHHPIFSPGGTWTYLSGQLGTFWQGEFLWHGRALAPPGAGAFYTVLSLVMIVAALAGLRPRLGNVGPMQCRAIGFSFAGVVAALGFFAFLSIIYDFHNCQNPSREHPYFHAGRMFLGALIPFSLLFVFGIDRVLNRFGAAAKFFALGGLVLFMFISEVATDWPVFSSPYNWFHM